MFMGLNYSLSVNMYMMKVHQTKSLYYALSKQVHLHFLFLFYDQVKMMQVKERTISATFQPFQ